jgi:hypothetical protein
VVLLTAFGILVEDDGFLKGCAGLKVLVLCWPCFGTGCSREGSIHSGIQCAGIYLLTFYH